MIIVLIEIFRQEIKQTGELRRVLIFFGRNISNVKLSALSEVEIQEVTVKTIKGVNRA